MNISIILTKVIVPRRRYHLLTRQRLLDLLSDLLDYRLTLLSAPAGYGKTSLLVDLAASVEYPVCWFALDPLDKNVIRFVAHFISSIKQQFPDFGNRSSTILQSAQQSELNLDQIVTTIVNEVYEHISEHFAIVLDDYHLIDESEDVNYFINRFGQEMDENCHLVIASRSLLRLPDLPLMVGRSQVKGLSFEELVFRPEEIRALLKRNYNQTVSDEEISELAHETEGWITGLLLSAETMWKGMSDRIRVARVSGVDVYDYLAQQVLDQQAPQVRNFLLRSSLMEEFNAELCQLVFGDADHDESWSDMIATVLYNNLFVQPLENGGTWLRYHHLFRDYLQAQILKEKPREAEMIIKKLVRVYAERHEWEKAYANCQRLDSDDITADLITIAGPQLAGSGQLKLLERWLSVLPKAIFDKYPYLMALDGAVVAMLGNFREGLVLLNKAEAALQEQNDTDMMARVLTWRATTNRILANYQDSFSDAQAALTISDSKEPLQAVQAEALRAMGMAQYGMGQTQQAVKSLGKSIVEYDLLGSVDKAAYVQVDLGYVHMETGGYKKALQHFQYALNVFRVSNDLIRLANVFNNLGVLIHLEGDLLQAEAYFSEALNCAIQSGYARIEAYALAGLGDLYTDLDSLDAALELYQKAKKIAQNVDEKSMVIYLSLASAKIQRKKEQMAQAQSELNSVGQLIRNDKQGYDAGLWELEKGILFIFNNNVSDALVALEKALSIFEMGKQNVNIVRTRIYLAYAYYVFSQNESAFEHLRVASELSEDFASFHPLLSVGQEVLDMLNEFKGESIVGKFSDQLLEYIRQFEIEQPRLRRLLRERNIQVSLAPPKLSIRVLGQAEVMMNGEYITKPEWANQRMVRELFFLLLNSSDGLSKETIGENLWPNSTASQFQKQFSNTIYRLRRALGKDTILLEARTKSYQFNRKIDYQYDVESFQLRVDYAQDSRHPYDDRLIAYNEAIDLYGGDYLPDIEGIWVLPVREFLRRAYLDAIIWVAEYYFSIAAFDDAMDYSQHLLVEDPFQEAGHRILMRIYANKGNRADVSRQYEQCRQTLQQLDIYPSHETVELYKQLMNN